MKKINIILDLDQTLIAAEPYENLNTFSPTEKENLKELKRLIPHHNMDNMYLVFERPGLQDFLDYLFRNFNVSIWTAASKDYACFIIDKIVLKDKNRHLDYIFFSYHCDISKRFMNRTQKKLKLLWKKFKLPGYNEKNTIIVDDYDHIYKIQPHNCIPADSFDILDENEFKIHLDGSNDSFLLKKLVPHLRKIKEHYKKNGYIKL